MSLFDKTMEPTYVVEWEWGSFNSYLLSANSIDVTSASIFPNTLLNISGTTNSIDPLKAISSIGSITFSLADKGITELLRSQNISGEYPSSNTIKIYVGTPEQIFSEYTLVATQVIEDISMESSGAYSIQCSDIQRTTKKSIFDLNITKTTTSISSASTIIGVEDESLFSELMVHDAVYTQNPSVSAINYVKVNDTIISYTGIDTIGKNITGCTVGVFNTPLTGSISIGVDIEQYIYIEKGGVELAYMVLTGKSYDGLQTLPSNYHLSIPDKFIDKLSFQNSVTQDIKLKVLGLSSEEGKTFIEKDILFVLGKYFSVKNTGEITLKTIVPVTSKVDSTIFLDDTDIISYSSLKYSTKDIVNSFKINWDYINSTYNQHLTVINDTSISKFDKKSPSKFDIRTIPSDSASRVHLQKISNFITTRYSGPSVEFSVSIPLSSGQAIAGDIITVSLGTVKDFLGSSSLTRSFELRKQNIDWMTGVASYTLVGYSFIQESKFEKVSLQNSFYTSSGVNLNTFTEISGSSVAGYTLDSNLSITGSTFDALSQVSGNRTYYLDGDFTIPQGITLSIKGDVTLKIQGSFDILGKIDGKGGSLYPEPQVTTRKSLGGLVDTIDPFALPIGVGRVRSGAELVINSGLQVTHNSVISPEFTTGYFPDPVYTSNAGTTLSGSVTQLSGVQGSPGKSFSTVGIGYNFTLPGKYTTDILPGAGGKGGAGLEIISRGGTILGSIDLSGTDGGNWVSTNPAPQVFQMVQAIFKAVTTPNVPVPTPPGFRLPGSGAGGAPGLLVWVMDGAPINAPVKTNNNILLFRGNSPKDLPYPEAHPIQSAFYGLSKADLSDSHYILTAVQ